MALQVLLSTPSSLIYFKDWALALNEARLQGKLWYENTKLLIFPYYSAETQFLQGSLDKVKAKLRSKGVPYCMIFPGKL